MNIALAPIKTLAKLAQTSCQYLIFLSVISCLFSIIIPAKGASLPQLSHFLINDTTSLKQTEVYTALTQSDTLDLGQVDKLEIHLQESSFKETELHFQLLPSEQQPSKTKYPAIRYSKIESGVHQLKLWQGKDTLNYTLLCSRPAPKVPVTEIWWFQPLLTFCLMLIPFTIFYFLALDRSRRNLRVEVVRNQIASDLHDDVGVNLSAIKNLAEVFKRKSQKGPSASTEKIVNRIQDYTDETLHKLQDTVWAINPRHDTIDALVDKMKDFATTMIPVKGMQLNFQNDYNPNITQKLDMPQRHSMFLMYKEAVNNILKHSQAKNVAIQISNTKKTINISIKDDGVGFDMEKDFAGNGLRNFQSRAKDNFIDFDLQSKEGEGTKISMVVYSLE